MLPLIIDVKLADRSYPIFVGQGLIGSGFAAEQIAAHARESQVLLVTHPLLHEKYAAPIEAGLRARNISVKSIQIPAGERYKTLRTVNRMYDMFLSAGLDRKSLVVPIGGGVLGDMAGFAAATYLRGIRFLQVPTTLLAQVDASVGGKTGVDLPGGKNLVGAFHQPEAVIIDTETLTSLPIRELRSGLAEVIKYGIIYDEAFYYEIEKALPDLLRREHAALIRIIARCCEIKAEVVEKDEREQGLRAILNFGHTIGHALESVTKFRQYKHGEAVSLGMIIESRLGELSGITSPDITLRLLSVLKMAGLPVMFPGDITSGSILEAASRDKKTISGKLKFLFPRRLGEVVLSGASDEQVRQALRFPEE